MCVSQNFEAGRDDQLPYESYQNRVSSDEVRKMNLSYKRKGNGTIQYNENYKGGLANNSNLKGLKSSLSNNNSHEILLLSASRKSKPKEQKTYKVKTQHCEINFCNCVLEVQESVCSNFSIISCSNLKSASDQGSQQLLSAKEYVPGTS